MTTINLVSPSSNGNIFNVRFREPINIKKNSKVYLNYASLTRDNKFYFNTRQTMSLTPTVILPTHRLNDVATPNTLTTNSITIGVVNETTGEEGYTMDELLQIIFNEMDLNIMEQNQLKIYKFLNEKEEGINKIGLEQRIGENLAFFTRFDQTQTNNGYGMLVNDADFEGGFKKQSVTNAVLPFYDCFVPGRHCYFNFSTKQANDNTLSIESGDSYIIAETNKSFDGIDDLTGKVSLGLFSVDMMEHTNGFNGWVHKTRGIATHHANYANPAIFRPGGGVQIKTDDADFNTVKQSGILGSFLTVEIDGLDKTMKVYMPINGLGQKPNEWNDINQSIVGMVLIHTEDLEEFYKHSVDPIRFAIQLYNPVTDELFKGENIQNYIQIFLTKTDEFGNEREYLIYNSIGTDNYFGRNFFLGLDFTIGTDAQKKAKLNSQTPFNIIQSSQVQGEGFKSVKLCEIPKTGTDTNPVSVILDYNFSFTTDLAEVLQTNLTSNTLYPNGTLSTNSRFLTFNNHIDRLNQNSYDIYLNNLPIKHYKNKEDETQGGFIKPILSTIPMPFLGSNSNTATQTVGGKIIGLYQPSIKNILELNNQEININNFDVEIKKTDTEETATEIEKAKISFVITSDEN